MFDDKSGNDGASPGRSIRDRRQGRDGWGIDAGPGLRNQPRKAVFVLDKPISNPGGHGSDCST